jgi:hypothetical protein
MLSISLALMVFFRLLYTTTPRTQALLFNMTNFSINHASLDLPLA